MIQRQGDVIIKKVNGVKGKKKDDLILAYGEITGHRHKLVCEKDDATLYEENGILYLHVEADEAWLYHGTDEQINRQVAGQEFDYVKEDCHKPQTLPKGDFEITIQREYVPGSWQVVSD